MTSQISRLSKTMTIQFSMTPSRTLFSTLTLRFIVFCLPYTLLYLFFTSQTYLYSFLTFLYIFSLNTLAFISFIVADFILKSKPEALISLIVARVSLLFLFYVSVNDVIAHCDIPEACQQS